MIVVGQLVVGGKEGKFIAVSRETMDHTDGNDNKNKKQQYHHHHPNIKQRERAKRMRKTRIVVLDNLVTKQNKTEGKKIVKRSLDIWEPKRREREREEIYSFNQPSNITVKYDPKANYLSELDG